MKELLSYILSNPYKNYIYSYPHKNTYRTFENPISLKELWSKPNFKNITLYVHIPFCENKCGYCNLFSSTCFHKNKLSIYVESLVEEIKAVAAFMNIQEKEKVFSNVILGGGTPTILQEFDLKKILDCLNKYLRIDFSEVFFSTEVSPRTITKSKIQLLEEYDINRVSMGIQSFQERELKNIYRFESIDNIRKALELLFYRNIPIKNLDLIYGIPNQTLDSWKDSLKTLLAYNPEEIYIYPIYLREKTKLYSEHKRNIDLMLNMYSYGKDFLKDNNYLQVSMRNFIRRDMNQYGIPKDGCQQNEMLGIGCGARSYIGNVHYSRKYAVKQKNINSIVEEYIKERNFSFANHGYILRKEELKRRYILKSILNTSGLDIKEYALEFKESPIEEFYEISFLLENGFLQKEENKIYPTDKGLKYSDSIGDLFISKEVAQKSRGFKE